MSHFNHRNYDGVRCCSNTGHAHGHVRHALWPCSRAHAVCCVALASPACSTGCLLSQRSCVAMLTLYVASPWLSLPAAQVLAQSMLKCLPCSRSFCV